jgi:hypothetical protein
MKLICSLFFLLTFSFSCTDEKDPEKNPQPTSNEKIIPANTTNPYSPVDISPMDMSYFPVDYPKLKMTNQAHSGPLARVVYSRPHLGGRTLFNEVIKYGEKWRLGANEATELQFFADATIEGKRIPAGRYVLYAIPQQDKWQIVLNTNIDTWGLSQDTTRDFAKFEVVVNNQANHLEYFTLIFETAGKNANLMMGWGNSEARLPISF